ncbi:MAG TPA: RNA polymerase sigma factor [Thermoanaerobaculia bacterium]|jgi:RNA polymerase sigma factor (sigma-70 family)
MTILKGGGGRDDERFDALYRKFYGRTYRYFRRARVADDEAHDLAQETFKKIYQAFAGYRGEAEWGFIEKTAKRTLLNWIRARHTQSRSATAMIEIDDPEQIFDPPAPEEPDFADRDAAERRRRAVVKAVTELPEGQRESLRLFILGFKYTEIAKALNTSVDAVKSRLRDAKKHLRARLGDKS